MAILYVDGLYYPWTYALNYGHCELRGIVSALSQPPNNQLASKRAGKKKKKFFFGCREEICPSSRSANKCKYVADRHFIVESKR